MTFVSPQDNNYNRVVINFSLKFDIFIKLKQWLKTKENSNAVLEIKAF